MPLAAPIAEFEFDISATVTYAKHLRCCCTAANMAELVERDDSVVAGLLAKLKSPDTALPAVSGPRAGEGSSTLRRQRAATCMAAPRAAAHQRQMRASAPMCGQPAERTGGGAAAAAAACCRLAVPPRQRRHPPLCLVWPQKYRILFSLRGIAGPAAHAAMLEGLKDPSALFRHEVSFFSRQENVDGSNNQTEAEVVLRNCLTHATPKLCCTAVDSPQPAHRFHAAPAWHPLTAGGLLLGPAAGPSSRGHAQANPEG